MALSPNFAVGPPPQASTVTYENGQYVSKPNPLFYIWTHRLWKWTQDLGNNADGDAVFSGNINTSGYIRATGGLTESGLNAAVIGMQATANFIGVLGYSTASGSIGVYGASTHASGIGVFATHGASGIALKSDGIAEFTAAVRLTGTGVGMEIGQTGAAGGTPFLDFHSNTNAGVDFDARIIVSTTASGSTGQARMDITCAGGFYVNGVLLA